MISATFLKAFAASAAIMLALDLLWLGVVAKGFYARHLATLLRPEVKWAPALLFYLLYIAAIVIFVVLPAAERKSLGYALAMGAFFGLAAYATYDLTSFALIRDFPLIVVVVDLAWGMVLTAVVSGAGYWAATR
ncbi:MAG: DUF2177 family protein [Gemmatimonadales bacterium]|nr:DUF2177 family protein [Gemmatimonadales bacterium]